MKKQKRKKDYNKIVKKSNTGAFANSVLIIYDLYELDKLNPLIPVFLDRNEVTANVSSIKCNIYLKNKSDNLEIIINRGKVFFQIEYLSEFKERYTTIYRCHTISKKKATHIIKKYGLDFSTIPTYIVQYFNNLIKEIGTGLGSLYGRDFTVETIDPGDDENDDDGYDSKVG